LPVIKEASHLGDCSLQKNRAAITLRQAKEATTEVLTKKVIVGKDEEDCDLFIIWFKKKDVDVFKRKYSL